MASKEIIRNYSNGEINVKWEPAKCIHTGICVRGLPQVFKPDERPWVQMENSDSATIKNQVEQCPVQALSCTDVNQDNMTENTNSNSSDSKFEIDGMPNGPLIVKEDFEYQDSSGNTQQVKAPSALCRCGATTNQPFCDGSHKKIDFKAS